MFLLLPYFAGCVFSTGQTLKFSVALEVLEYTCALDMEPSTYTVSVIVNGSYT